MFDILIVRCKWFGYDNRGMNWFLALTGAHRFQADVQGYRKVSLIYWFLPLLPHLLY